MQAALDREKWKTLQKTYFQQWTSIGWNDDNDDDDDVELFVYDIND